MLLLTPHKAYDLDSISQKARVVFDTRNAYGTDRRPTSSRSRRSPAVTERTAPRYQCR